MVVWVFVLTLKTYKFTKNLQSFFNPLVTITYIKQRMNMNKLLLSLSLIFLMHSTAVAEEGEEGSYWERLKNKVSLEKIEGKIKEGVDKVKEKVTNISIYYRLS